jgi:hypothetical protein
MMMMIIIIILGLVIMNVPSATDEAEILISNFHHVLNVVCFLLGNSPASEFYMTTFRNTLFHLHRRLGTKNTTFKIRRKF